MRKTIMFLSLVVITCSCGNISTTFKEDTKVSISAQEKVNEQYRAIRSYIGDSIKLNDVYLVNITDDTFYAYQIGIDKPIPIYKILLKDNMGISIFLGILIGAILVLVITHLINN